MSAKEFAAAISPYFSHMPKKSSSGVTAVAGIASYLESMFTRPEELLIFASSGMFSSDGILLVFGEGRVAALRFMFDPDNGDAFSISGVVQAVSVVQRVAIESASTAFAERNGIEVRPVVRVNVEGFGEVAIGKDRDVEWSNQYSQETENVRLRALLDAVK